MKRVHSAIQHAFYSNTFLLYADWQLSTSTWYWHENAKKKSTITQEIEKKNETAAAAIGLCNRHGITGAAISNDGKLSELLTVSVCVLCHHGSTTEARVKRLQTTYGAAAASVFLYTPDFLGRNHRMTATATSPILCLWKIWFHSQ